ncbi:hypothetical protein ACMHYO_11025, partial [Allopusillimonas ginsengisoli]
MSPPWPGSAPWLNAAQRKAAPTSHHTRTATAPLPHHYRITLASPPHHTRTTPALQPRRASLRTLAEHLTTTASHQLITTTQQRHICAESIPIQRQSYVTATAQQ